MIAVTMFLLGGIAGFVFCVKCVQHLAREGEIVVNPERRD